MLARFLFAHTQKLSLRLLDLNGTLRNAIPREASAVVAVPAAKVDALKTLSQHFLGTLQNELSAKEKNITVLLDPIASAEQAMLESALLNSTPNGVIRA